MKAVTVACRVRPPHPAEETGPVTVDGASVAVDNSQGERSFSFDHAFQEIEDDAMWEQLKLCQLTQKTLEGYHATVMAYGQTGSGKTYTIDGGPSENGAVCRAARSLFEQIQEKEGRFVVRVSYLQLYLEKIFDLLNPAPWLLKTSNDKRRTAHLQKQPGLRMRKNVNGWYVENLYETECANAEEVMTLWKFGRESKQIAQTAMNACSSRSHSMFVIQVEKQDPNNLTYRCTSKLSIVDLAGSEKPSGTTTARFQESININGSLFVLRKVVTALVHGSTHVPYRESKLTCLLKQSLGGSSYLVMLACISPALQSMEESIATLHYATQAAHIQNAPKANKDPRQELIEQLRAEVAHLQSYIVDTLKQALPPDCPRRESKGRTQSALRSGRRKSRASITLEDGTGDTSPRLPACAPNGAATATTPRGPTRPCSAPLTDNARPAADGDSVSIPVVEEESPPAGTADASPRAGRTNSVPPNRRAPGPGAPSPRKKRRSHEQASLSSRFAAFASNTDNSSFSTPRGGVRALAQWFNEQRKDVYADKAAGARTPTRTPRYVAQSGAKMSKTYGSATQAWTSSTPRNDTSASSGAGAVVKDDEQPAEKSEPEVHRQASIEELMVACRYHKERPSRSSTKTSSRTERSLTPTRGHDPKTTYGVPLYRPSRPSTPSRVPSAARIRKMQAGRTSSCASVASGRTTPRLKSGASTPGPQDRALTPGGDAEPVVDEQTEVLAGMKDVYLEQIHTLEHCNDGLQNTLQELQEASSQQRKMERQIIEELETAYHEAAEQIRILEDSSADRIASLEAKIMERETELRKATQEAESLSHRLSAAEAVAVCNLKSAGNVSNEADDMKSMLRGVLTEWVEKRFVSDTQAQELRKEVAGLKKKKWMLLSMMGKAEALQIKEDIRSIRRVATVEGREGETIKT